MKATTIYKILHFIPLLAILGMIAIVWSDPFLGSLLLVGMGLIVIAIIVLAVFGVIYGIKTGGVHAKAIIGTCVIIVIAFILLVTVGIPNYGCDPFKMKKYFEKNGNKLYELVDYTRNLIENPEQLDSLCYREMHNGFFIGLDSKFKLSPDCLNNSYSSQTEYCNEIGLNMNEFETIKSKLKKAGCLHINIFREFCDVGYKSVGFGMYSFRIYSRDLTDEEKSQYMEDYCFIPYNRRVLFEFGGGAVGPQQFGSEYKEQYLKDNPPDW